MGVVRNPINVSFCHVFFAEHVHGKFSGFSFYSLPVDNFFHKYERVGYSGHGNERGAISGDDGDERRDINCDDSDKRGDISADDGRRVFRSQDTSHSSFQKNEEVFDGDWRGGYRSHTSHYFSHNPDDHGRLLHLSVASCCVHESIHENERGDISGDDGICGFRSQDSSHSSFQNNG